MDTARPSPGASADGLYAKVGLRLIPFLILCYFFASLDRSNIAIAKLQFAKQIGVDEVAYGLGGGLFYIGYCLFEVPSNLVLSRIGARRTIMRIMVLWSLFSAAMAFMQGPVHFYILRFLIGVAEAGFFPGVLYYLGFWAPPSRRARLTAAFMSAMALSGVIGNPASGLIVAKLDGVAGLHGWQWMFLIEGLPGVLVGLAAFFALDNSPEHANWLSEDEKARIAADLLETPPNHEQPHASIWAALRDKQFLALSMMSVAMISGMGGLALWTPTILRAMGIKDVAEIGWLTAIPYVAAVIVQQIVAQRSDARGERRWHAAACALIAGAGWLALPLFAHQPWLALGLLTVATAATFGATGPFWAMPSTLLSGSAAASGIALITTLGGLSGFVSPIIVGWAAARTHSLAIGQDYYGALMVIAGLGLLICIPKPRTSEARHKTGELKSPAEASA